MQYVLHLQQSWWVLSWTRLQMAFWLQYGFRPIPISASTAIHKECFLNDKPLKQSNLKLQWCNQWRNNVVNTVTLRVSKKFTSSAHNKWNYVKFNSFSQPESIFMRTFFLDKFLLFIPIDIFHSKHGTNHLKSDCVKFECEIKTTTMLELYTLKLSIIMQK